MQERRGWIGRKQIHPRRGLRRDRSMSAQGRRLSAENLVSDVVQGVAASLLVGPQVLLGGLFQSLPKSRDFVRGVEHVGERLPFDKLTQKLTSQGLFQSGLFSPGPVPSYAP